MAILNESMQQLVRAQRLGFVATVCEDGTPNLSPRGTLAVWDDGHLVFADLRSPGTTANLRANPAVEVNVVDWLSRKGYRFKGKARVLEEGPEFERGLDFYANWGLSDAPGRIRAVVLIQVERAKALLSPAYDSGVSEWQIRRQWRQYYEGLL